MKNKKNRKVAAAALSLGSAAVLLAGGTFAWYVVSNTAEATIGGTATKVEDMKVGIVGLGDTDGFTKDETVTDIWWKDSYGKNTQAAFDSALTAHVKNANEKMALAPVTTGKWDGEEIKLYKNPTEAVPTLGGAAGAADYIEYTLAFKTEEGETPIYFNRAGMNFAFTSGNDEAHKKMIKTLRVGVTDELATADKHNILAPFYTADKVDETTIKVGGTLDLNGDGVWDYKAVRTDGVLSYETIWYGTSVAPATQVELAAEDQKAAPEPKSNSVSSTGKYLDSAYAHYSAPVTKPEATADTQVAHGMDYFTYVAGATDNHPIAVSGADGIAKITVKIWLEGWDVNCVNDIAETNIDTTLAFVAPVKA